MEYCKMSISINIRSVSFERECDTNVLALHSQWRWHTHILSLLLHKIIFYCGNWIAQTVHHRAAKWPTFSITMWASSAVCRIVKSNRMCILQFSNETINMILSHRNERIVHEDEKNELWFFHRIYGNDLPSAIQMVFELKDCFILAVSIRVRGFYTFIITALQCVYVSEHTAESEQTKAVLNKRERKTGRGNECEINRIGTNFAPKHQLGMRWNFIYLQYGRFFSACVFCRLACTCTHTKMT